MTEIEYIKAINRAKLHMVEKILRDVMQGDDYDIDGELYSTAVNAVWDLMGSIDIKISEGME